MPDNLLCQIFTNQSFVHNNEHVSYWRTKIAARKGVTAIGLSIKGKEFKMFPRPAKCTYVSETNVISQNNQDIRLFFVCSEVRLQ